MPCWIVGFPTYLKPISGRFLFAAGITPLMYEFVLPALYYLLMLAGSVSLGKVVLLLAAGGEEWTEDERATGLASIAGFAVVLLGLLLQLFVLNGSAFPAVLAFGGIATVATRVFLFKKTPSNSMPHLDELMEETLRDERQASPANSPVQPPSLPRASQERSPVPSWAARVGTQSPSVNEAFTAEREPSPSQKIGEVIRMQGKQNTSAPLQPQRPKKPGNGEGAKFEEIKWLE